METDIKKEKGIKCKCQDCKVEFESYSAWENCNCCNDGFMYDDNSNETNEQCTSCDGGGDHVWIEMGRCEDCLTRWLSDDDLP